MATVAIYVRTSTDDQHGEAQLRELRALAPGAAEYIDRGESGATPARQRPALRRLLDDARAGKVKGVAVFALDRLGRNVADLVLTVEELGSSGCAVLSKKEGALDPNTAMGRFMLHIFAAIAEMERGRIRERVRSGVANARAKGKRLGRPRREVDVAEAVKLRQRGYPWRRAAMALGVPTATLRRAVGDAAPCACSHPIAWHRQGNGACLECSCTSFEGACQKPPPQKPPATQRAQGGRAKS